MILIGLGSNLPHPEIGTPDAVLRVSLQEIHAKVGRLVRVSPFLSTQPVPISDQPWYQNAVCEIESQRQPAELLADLHAIEADFGRIRSVRNAARILDLDLLVYGDHRDPHGPPILPHPRMFERDFVMVPLAAIRAPATLPVQRS
ncbi:2-amino-4-hydroxy-6-hydroxymethyldihydropteridine diphosphokinase [Alphaproteobacteria bacterium]|nr:2-amino-4-hydroxy-6-hydroxymethyldihydropteridine diphosphokinase [Alphaproteobacteria bacterium]